MDKNQHQISPIDKKRKVVSQSLNELSHYHSRTSFLRDSAGHDRPAVAGMKITILGSGTSGGIPEPGCSCPVCQSDDPRDQRYRASILVTQGSSNVLIDAATEFRLQMLREQVTGLDALLVTHAHADHISGMDDLRNFTRDKALPVFGNEMALVGIRERFGYFFRDTQRGGGKPRVELNVITKEFVAGGMKWEPLPVWHGRIPVLGFRTSQLAYITDASEIPPQTEAMLKGLDLLILGALRYRPHETHLCISQAVELAIRLKPKQTFLTHFCHDISHKILAGELPPFIAPAYDGLHITL